MELKHTPGNWKLQTYRIYASQSGRAEYPIHAPKRGLIAKAFKEQDARLIAAAPELLEALQAILRDGMHCDVVPHLHEKALAAISKATGEK